MLEFAMQLWPPPREIGAGRGNFQQGHVMTETAGIKPVELLVNGRPPIFHINNPELPSWIDKAALGSGNYPYDKKLDGDVYDDTLKKLQIELVKLQFWLQAT